MTVHSAENYHSHRTVLHCNWLVQFSDSNWLCSRCPSWADVQLIHFIHMLFNTWVLTKVSLSLPWTVHLLILHPHVPKVIECKKLSCVTTTTAEFQQQQCSLGWQWTCHLWRCFIKAADLHLFSVFYANIWSRGGWPHWLWVGGGKGRHALRHFETIWLCSGPAPSSLEG